MNEKIKHVGTVAVVITLLLMSGLGQAVTVSSTLQTANPEINGTIYVGSNDGNLYAMNASDGTVKWSYTTSNWIQSEPTVVNDTVYAGSVDNEVFALNATDGTKRWSFTAADSVYVGPTVVNDTVYIGSNAGLYALNASDGTQKWKAKTGTLRSSPNVIGGTVYVGSVNNGMHAIDVDTGNFVWNNTEPTDVRASPTVVDKTVYFGTQNGTDSAFYALNISDGTKRWDWAHGYNIYSSPTVVNDTIYFGSYSNSVFALNRTDGTQKWTYTGATDYIYSSPTVVNGSVYFGSDDGYLYAVDAVDGTEQWKTALDTTNGIFGSPTESEGLLFIGDKGGHVYAVDASDGSIKWDNGVSDGASTYAIRSSPTVVLEGSSRSNDSRVQLGTLGHHEQWNAQDVKSVSEIRNAGTESDKSLNLDITDYQEPNTTKEYRVYYIKDGKRTNVTENATLTSANTSIIKINSGNYTMSSGKVNATVNVTAKYDGLSDTVEVSVAQVDMNYISILPPAYWITAIIVDPTMQWLFVAIVIGAVAGQMSRNKWAGMGTIQTVILIGWAIDLVDDGILMAAIAFLIFAGLITMQGSSQAEPIE